MRLNKIKAAFVAAVAAVSMSFNATAASANTNGAIPDPGQWCYDWAQANSSKAAGVEINFLGVVGSSSKNNAKCKFVYVYGVSENVGGRWYGYNGVMPATYLPVNFDSACKQQYPGTHVKWFSPTQVPQKITEASRKADMGFTWQCVS